MDSFVKYLIGVLVALQCFSALASFPPSPQIIGYVIGQDGSVVYPNTSDACTAAAGAGNTGTLTTSFEFPHFIQLSRHCDVVRNSDNQNLGQVGIFYRLSEPMCPSNSTLVNGQCSCTAPNVENPAGNGCAPPNICNAMAGLKAGSDTNEVNIGNVSGSVIGAATGQTRNFCHLGCVAAGTVTGGLKEPSGAVILFVENANWTNSPCSTAAAPGAGTGGSEPGQQKEPTLCSAKKKCTGEVNGISICVPCSTFGEGGTTTTTTTASGTGTATAPGGGSSTIPNGTTTTGGTTSTQCTGTKCTTTTTENKTNPDGTTTQVTQQKEHTLDDYCKANPRSPACADNQFGGACTTGFTATGDALASAAAIALNKINCAIDPGNGTDGTEAALVAGTFGPELATTNRSFSQFDQSNPLGASCPPDLNISIMSSTITIPLSQACWALQALGYIAVAFTLLYSTIFVVKGF